MPVYRIFVSDYFWSGLLWSALVLAAILMAQRRVGRLPTESAGTHTHRERPGATACALVALLVILVPRVLILDKILHPAFVHIVEAMDSCIAPFQQKLGLRLWGVDLMTHATNDLVSSFAVLSHGAFGFDPLMLRFFHSLSFALSVAFFVHGLHRAFGASVALAVAGTLAASYPFLWHSMWATAMGAGALPALLYFGLLMPRNRVSPSVALASGCLLGASLLIYPGATIAMGSFLVFDVLYRRERWTAGVVGFLAVGTVAAKWALDWAYGTPFSRVPDAGGFLSLHYFTESLRVTPQDFFYRSTSFATMNFGGPYFEPVLLWALVLALLHPNRVFLLCVSVFLLNIVVTGVTGPYPGARRVLWSLPLLYAGSVQAVFRNAAGAPRVTALVKAAFVVSLSLLCARDVVIGRRHFPIFPPDRLYPEAAAFLEKHAPLDAEIVLFEEGMFDSKHYWCALGFTKELWRPGRVPLLVPKGKPYPAVAASEYWVLMQPDDNVEEVQQVFGPAEVELLYPGAAAARTRVEDRVPLRVLRVRPLGPASASEKGATDTNGPLQSDGSFT